MKKLLILVWTLTAASAQAANPMTTTTDTKAVLGLLRGNVDMYGVNFGSSVGDNFSSMSSQTGKTNSRSYQA